MIDSDMLSYNLNRLDTLHLRGSAFFEVDCTRFWHLVSYCRLHDLYPGSVPYVFGPHLYYFITSKEAASRLYQNSLGCIQIGYLPDDHRKLCLFLSDYLGGFSCSI